jgi:hypothetical protein
MPLEEIIHKTDYLSNGRTVFGSFPITINGNINCVVLNESPDSRDVILSEGMDPYLLAQKQYLQTFDGNYYNLNNGRGDFILFF